MKHKMKHIRMHFAKEKRDKVTLSILSLLLNFWQPSVLILSVIKQSSPFCQSIRKGLSSAIASTNLENGLNNALFRGKPPLCSRRTQFVYCRSGCLMVISWEMMKNSFLISIRSFSSCRATWIKLLDRFVGQFVGDLDSKFLDEQSRRITGVLP